MSCQCEPHRKMAADGARTKNANPHGVEILLGGKGVASFHKLWFGATGHAMATGITYSIGANALFNCRNSA